MTTPKSSAEPDTGLVSAEQAAALLMISGHRLRQLARAGVIPRPARDRYPLVQTVQAYLTLLADPVRSGRTEADRKLAAIKTRQIESAITREAAGLIPADEVIAFSRLVSATLLDSLDEYAATFDEPMASRMRASIDAVRGDVERLVVEFDEKRGAFHG